MGQGDGSFGGTSGTVLSSQSFGTKEPSPCSTLWSSIYNTVSGVLLDVVS